MASPGWVLIQSALTDSTGNTPYFVTCTFSSGASGVALNNASASYGFYWMFTFDTANTGRIRSKYAGYVLSVDANNNLIAEQEVIPTPARQLWDLNVLWDGASNLVGLYEISNHQSGILAVNPCSLTQVPNGTP